MNLDLMTARLVGSRRLKNLRNQNDVSWPCHVSRTGSRFGLRLFHRRLLRLYRFSHHLSYLFSSDQGCMETLYGMAFEEVVAMVGDDAQGCCGIQNAGEDG